MQKLIQKPITLILLSLWIFASCKSGSEVDKAFGGGGSGSSSSTTTVIQNPSSGSGGSDGSVDLSNKRVLKIITSGVGAGTAIGDTALVIGNTLSLRAALFDLANQYDTDVAVSWSFTNATFPNANLSIMTSSTTTVFTPSTIGTTTIQATYSGAADVISTTNSTGTITVTTPQVATSMVLIAGDAQSAVVNNNLATALQVEVRDAFGVAMPGTQVLYSVTGGSGAIIGANPVTTDSNGRASVLVKVGTTSGTNNNNYRATSVDTPALTVDFVASATYGAPNNVYFSTEPAVFFSNAPFGVQPVVRLRDVYNNLIPSSAINATLSVQTGSGALTGTTTATVTNGVATFSNVGYNTAEAGVVLRATISGVTGDSAAFTVGAAPPGACLNNDGWFTTADGGCKDLSTGLVWSAKSAATMGWAEAVWDSTQAGEAAPDANDYGRTNDYDNINGKGTCNSGTCNHANSYCRALNEGGQLDWRMPTQAEITAVYTNMFSGAGVTSYLPNVANETVFASGAINSSTSNRPAGNFTTGITNNSSGSGAMYARCVRAGSSPRTLPDNLVVTSGPLSKGTIYASVSNSITVRIRDSNNNYVTKEGVNVTLSSASIGNLGGTTTVATDHLGRAIFSAYTLDTVGTNILITITSAGLTSTSYTIPVVGNALHTCKAEDGNWTTADGGCKHVTSGKVFSARSATTMSWHHAVWDDGMGGNDYDGGNSLAGPDTDPAVNYCHDLVESGYSDWRLPTNNEMFLAYGAGGGTAVGAYTYWGYATSVFVNEYMTSTSSSDVNHIARRLDSNTANARAKTGGYYVFCVRN